MKTHIYIDGANLYQGSKSWGGIDYTRFWKWIQDKYKPQKVYMFLGYVKGNETLYSSLSALGYTLIFKETLEIQGKVKGNVDAELVVQSMMHYYEHDVDQSLIVTGDGDFACLLDFLIAKRHRVKVLAPNRTYLSYLIKKRNVPIVLLEEQQHKLQKIN